MKNKIHELREEAIKKHEELMAYFDAQERVFAPLFDELEKLDPTSLRIDDSYASISLTGDKHKLNAAFGVLRRFGFEPTTRPEAKSSNYSTFFTKTGGGLRSEVWFSFSSTQCRRVKVGSKTRVVEEDVYETVCDEQEYPGATETKREEEELPF